MAKTVKCLSTMWEIWVQSLGSEDLLEKEMATHSSIPAWRIPWTKEPGGPPCVGLQSQTWLSDWACTHMSVEAYKPGLSTPRAHPANHCAGGWITVSLFPTKKEKKCFGVHTATGTTMPFFYNRSLFFLTKLPSVLLWPQEGGPTAGHIIPELEESRLV